MVVEIVSSGDGTDNMATTTSIESNKEKGQDDDNARQNSFLVEGSFQEFDGYIKNASTMYQLIIESSWDAVIERCKVAPEEAKKWIVRGSIDSWRRLPLHEACIRQANVEVVKALIEAFSLAAKSFDHSARLPLHHACFHGCSIEVVRVLVGAYPTGLDKKDVFEKTPLVLAGSSSSKNKSLIVETLMKGPSECIIEGYRSKWEKDQQLLLFTLRNELAQEKAAIEMKMKHCTEEAKLQAYISEKESAKKTSTIDDMNKQLFELNNRFQTVTLSEQKLMEKIKEMEDRFSSLCVSNHVTSKKKHDKIIEQAEIIMSMEAKVEELDKYAKDLDRKVSEKNVSDAKFTKQIVVLRATVGEHNKKEETWEQEITKLRADFTASRREVLSLVQKAAQSNAEEKELRSQLKDATDELEALKLSNQLLQDSKVMLQEQVTQMKGSHEEAIQLSLDTQARAELDKQNTAEELDFIRKELEGKEKKIKSIEQSSLDDHDTFTTRISQLETKVEHITKHQQTQEKTHEEEKQSLTQMIAALNEDAAQVKEQVQKDQAKAQETIRLFKSALRKFTVDRDNGSGPA